MSFPRRSLVLPSLLLPAVLAGAGCVSADDIEGLHRQMTDIETQIQALERKSSSKEEVSKLNANVSQQTQQLLKSNADSGVRLGELTVKMEQLEAKLEDTNRRLSQLSQQIAETQGDLARMRGPSSPAPAPTPSGRPGPLERDRPSNSSANAALAVQGFQEYVDTYPNTDLTDNAQYWIGECHYAQKKYKEAVADFDRVLKQWPKSDKAAAAFLKKGYALLELGQKAEAVVELQYAIHEYPSAEEARLARAKLKTLGVDVR